MWVNIRTLFSVMVAGTFDVNLSAGVSLFLPDNVFPYLFMQGLVSTILSSLHVSCPYLIALKLSQHFLVRCLQLFSKARSKYWPGIGMMNNI